MYLQKKETKKRLHPINEVRVRCEQQDIDEENDDSTRL